MEHWLSSSAYIDKCRKQLSAEEGAAFDFLNNAWRDNEFSEELSRRADKQIDVLVRNDERHGNLPDLKTQIQRFRGVAANIYTVNEAYYRQFRTELLLRFPQSGNAGGQRNADSGGSGSDRNAAPRDNQRTQTHTPSDNNTSSSPSTPPPPPPAGGRPILQINDAGIDILNRRGSVLSSSCAAVPQGTEMLRPTVSYRTTVMGSKWKITCRLVKATGTEVAISVNECTAESGSGSLTLNPFGNCAMLAAGHYKMLVYANGRLHLTKEFDITPAADSGLSDISIRITDIIAGDADGNPTQRTTTTTTQYITPVIEIFSSSPAVTRRDVKLRIKVCDPNGNMIAPAGREGGFTAMQTVSFIKGDTVRLKAIGSEQGTAFLTEGSWRIEILWGEGKRTSKTFSVKRPISSVSPLTITDVDFFHDPADRKGADGETYAPEPLPSYIEPRISYTLASAVDVVEISYKIYTYSIGSLHQVQCSETVNHRVSSSGTLELSRLKFNRSPLPNGRYAIRFTINGVESAVFPFFITTHIQDVNTTPAEDDNTTSEEGDNTTPEEKKESCLRVLVYIILILIVAAGAWTFFSNIYN